MEKFLPAFAVVCILYTTNFVISRIFIEPLFIPINEGNKSDIRLIFFLIFTFGIIGNYWYASYFYRGIDKLMILGKPYPIIVLISVLGLSFYYCAHGTFKYYSYAIIAAAAAATISCGIIPFITTIRDLWTDFTMWRRKTISHAEYMRNYEGNKNDGDDSDFETDWRRFGFNEGRTHEYWRNRFKVERKLLKDKTTENVYMARKSDPSDAGFFEQRASDIKRDIQRLDDIYRTIKQLPPPKRRQIEDKRNLFIEDKRKRF